MPLSLFVLGLYVFLQSAVYMAWFAVDNKLLGFVGIAFVVILIIESIATLHDNNWKWKRIA